MFNFFQKIFNSTKQLNSAERIDLRQKWQEIEESAKLGGEARLHKAIISADNLIDRILKLKNLKGETMAERLKNAKNIYSREILNDLWSLHKLRNRIVHEESEVLSFEINKVLEKAKTIIQNV